MTSHDFPSKRCHIYLVFNETGCKGTTKNAYTQEKWGLFSKKDRFIYPKIIKYYRKLLKIIFRNKNTLRYKNYKKSIVIFWFAQKGNLLPGEQNKNGNI